MEDGMLVSGAGELFSQLDSFLFIYGRTIFEATSGIFLGVFMSFYACKIMWDVFHKTTIKQKFEIEDFIKPIFICAFLTTILVNSVLMETWVVRPIYDLSVGLATITASLTSNLPEGSNIVTMLDLVDNRLNDVIFKQCHEIQKNIGMIEFPLHVGIWIIEGLYLFVWFLFLALMVEALFRFMTFFAISPLLIPAFFFSATKPIATAGFKSLLHGLLSMFMAGVAMGLTIAIIGESPEKFFSPMTSDWIFGQGWCLLLLVALISISFHLKAPKIAANLANIDDGPGAAAAVAGLGTMAMMSGKAAMGRLAGGGARAGAGLAKKGISSGAGGVGRGFSDLYHKMTGK